MKAKLVVLALALLITAAAIAQSAHSVTLNWNASVDSGVAYNLYRATSACPASGLPANASKIASGLTVLTYNDVNVTTGNAYCYYVTATLNGVESLPSNNANAVILPAAPSALTVTVK